MLHSVNRPLITQVEGRELMRTASLLAALAFVPRVLTGQIEHVRDQFAGSEAWFTKNVGLAKLEQNHCDIWLVFGVERSKQTATEFVRADYASVQMPFSHAKPLGLLADVTLQFAVGDTMISGQPFHPLTADKKLVVKGYSSTKTDIRPA